MIMKHVINAVQTYRLGIEIIYEFIDAAFFISPKTRIFWSLQSGSECPLSLQLTQKMSLGWWAKVQSFPCLHPGRNLHILVFTFLPLLKKSSSTLGWLLVHFIFRWHKKWCGQGKLVFPATFVDFLRFTEAQESDSGVNLFWVKTFGTDISMAEQTEA